MVLKVEFFFTIFVYYIIGIHTENPSCRLIDFNNTDAVFEFEGCFSGNLFTYKSYEEELLVPFRDDSVYYLSNFLIGYSCFASTQLFYLDEFSEFDVIVYLDSGGVDDASYVEIQVYDTDEGDVYFLGRLAVSSEWKVFNKNFNEIIENAQIEIRAFTTLEAVLAIEYIHIANSEKGDVDCNRIGTTIEPTTSSTTTSTTTSTRPFTTSPTPIDSNENRIWIILSFVFLSITVVVAVVSFYMIYLYRTTVKRMPVNATTKAAQTGLPRLTVTTTSNDVDR